MNKNIFTWFLVALALLAIAGGTWWYLSVQAPASSKSKTDNSPAAALVKQNQNFVAGLAYQKAGDYNLALQSYEKALAETQDSSQKAQLLFSIAYANERLGKYADAIAKYKAIAADTSNFPISRAASVQQIGLMFFTYYGAGAQQTILTETFKDAPYNTFNTTGSTNLAYTKLFEYAASIYPLAGSEVRIAYGYTNELIDTLQSATTTPQGKAYLALIQESLKATDADLGRMFRITVEHNLIPEILVREGTTYDRLFTLGVESAGVAEPYFKQAVPYSLYIGSKPGTFIPLNYGIFLTKRYGTERAADITTLLAPFKVGNGAQISSTVVAYLKAARTSSTAVKERPLLVKMGQMVPDFKTYLVSLGWKASDF